MSDHCIFIQFFDPSAICALSDTSPTPVIETPRYTVAVRTLCEFTAKAGDLDLRFTPSPTSQEGVAGHGVVTSRRGSGYESEVSLSGEFEGLRVRGRADGYDPVANRVEEIKTVRGEKIEIPENHQALHWAQAKIYGWLLCESRKLEKIEVALVYFDIVSQRERMLKARFDAATLREFFEDSCRRFKVWAERELAHRSARDAGLQALAFPHGTFREGQRLLAESVYKANVSARTLLAQAPTGIGKSIGTVFPALKAMPTQRIDKLFFLSARSTGRAVALHATAQLRRNAADTPLRVLELTARDKTCEHPDLACHGESCPLAQGFYDRLPAAREAASHAPLLDRQTTRDIARAHQVCPYYLAQEMIRWSDLVVADYNYYFDRSALLFALTVMNEWRVSVLVDEAHNLVDRGRAMYTSTLDHAAFRGVRLSAPAVLKKPMDHVYRQWNALAKSSEAEYETRDEEPAAFVEALVQLCTAIIDDMSEHPQRHDALLERFYFDAMHFLRLAEQLTEYGGKHSLFDITRTPRLRAGVDASLCVRNLLPAPYLATRFGAAHSTTLFSATLQPADYYGNLLGLPDSAVWVEVPSPFRAEQLDVHVARHISTRYAQRQRSLPAIVALMAAQFAQRPGNYLAFFSSHDYLQQAAALLAESHPDIPIWVQARGMNEAGQSAFLDAFVAGGRGIGFAVLGGVFSEGVDLPGDRLIGAFVATLGLPQVNPINEQLRDRMEKTFGQGYDYAYLYPGLRKVVQAAGRVIRTQEDRGVVWLIDDRYGRSEVKELLPGWWEISAGPDLQRSISTDTRSYALPSPAPAGEGWE